LEYFVVIWYILWSFGNIVLIWYISLRFGILCQEKSGNPDTGESFLITMAEITQIVVGNAI
jgi:hypothetical protein